jgi:PLP dependent protein
MTPKSNNNDILTIAERITSAYARVKKTHTGCEFKHTINILAVSKTKPLSLIKKAYESGVRQFGESYVKEAVDKIQVLKNVYHDIEWHFIGPIQANKSRLIAENFSWVQSVDRLKIAKRLNEQRPTNLKPLNILIQVNISEDSNKSGCHPHDLDELAQFIVQAKQLNLRGLMTITEKTSDTSKQLNYFKQMRCCFDKLNEQYPQVDTLSMGMSGDLEQAIMAGSNMVRIGTDIFGKRQ